MITEDYVSFEIAKLLKEKGFEGHSIITIYDEDAANAYVKELIEKHLPYSSDDPKLKEFYYVKPTLQMAMKWLREVHNIDIIVPPQYDNVKWTYSAVIIKLSIPCTEIRLNDNKDKKEEACEAAIKYCLEHLI